MPAFFARLQSERKLAGTRRGKRHLLVHVSNPRNGLHICKLAKERRFTKQDETTYGVEPVQDHEYPYITVILETVAQVVLIQKKTTAFSELKDSQRALEEVFSRVGRFGRFRFVLAPISLRRSFWDVVDTAEEIYRLQITIEGPNFFSDAWKGEDIARKLERFYGSTKTDVALRNDGGQLKIPREDFADPVRVVSAGGGEYRLRFRRKGHTRSETITNTMTTIHVILPGEAERLDAGLIDARLAEVDRASWPNEHLEY